jgi:hypothetical protein
MSKSITDLWPEEIARLVDALTKQFASALQDDAFELLSQGDEEAVQLRCRIVKADRSQVYLLEVRARVKNFDSRDMACTEAVDVLGYVIEQFFSSGREVIPPLDWAPFGLGGGEVLIRGDLRNQLIDEAADKLLARDVLSRDVAPREIDP